VLNEFRQCGLIEDIRPGPGQAHWIDICYKVRSGLRGLHVLIPVEYARQSSLHTTPGAGRESPAGLSVPAPC